MTKVTLCNSIEILAVIRVLTEHINVEKLRPGLGLELVTAFCSDLDRAVELDDLRSPGIENRVICRAIGL